MLLRVETELVHGHQVAFLPSTIWPDSLMIKLAGIMSGSINFKNNEDLDSYLEEIYTAS